jgi:hypothetical protein
LCLLITGYHHHSHSSTLAPPTATAVPIPENSKHLAMQQSNVGNNAANASARGAGGKPVIYSFQKLLSSTYRELKNFVMSPAPSHMIVRCYVERNRSNTNFMTPVYSLCADLEDGTGRELMVCKKVLSSRSSHYVFSLKADDLYLKRDRRSRLYLGKLRAVSNNEYVLYDNGICAAPDDPDSLLEALEDDSYTKGAGTDRSSAGDKGELYSFSFEFQSSSVCLFI